MALDEKIAEAICEAVSEYGQHQKLALRLIAWLEAVTSGNEDINDAVAAQRHLDVLYDATSVDKLLDIKESI